MRVSSTFVLESRTDLTAALARVFEGLYGYQTIQIQCTHMFAEAGWIGRDAILMTGINAIIYILSTLPP